MKSYRETIAKALRRHRSAETDSGFVGVISWTQGPGIGLQKQTKLSDVWEEVPDSLGQAEATLDLTSDVQRPPTFFRLVAP